ncbi:hypothetical protein SACS_0075 [Parasaccharibacter apium]|uniref:Uncharacterized protein n=1 Tax=Parasaccharibacter apium TaxID=1510841 RepID=A0A7U7G470_9PROT|nr:hypothetical protein SACS_0075 [Parasaccharibacter apium]
MLSPAGSFTRAENTVSCLHHVSGPGPSHIDRSEPPVF